MINFDDLDVQKGFVLEKDEAIDYINYLSYNHYKAAMEGDEEFEELSENLKDLKEYREFIEHSKVEYFKIFEHPMSISGIHVVEMKECI